MAAKADARRAQLLDALSQAGEPVAGGALAHKLGVSRQVIVQDIALLRRDGSNIVSTTKGYVLANPPEDSKSAEAEKSDERHGSGSGDPERDAAASCSRTFKVHHTVDEAADELRTIVEAGGHVRNVSISHRVYGRVTAPLDIASEADIARFIEDIESGKSSPLCTATSGYHYHLVSAENEQAIEHIGRALADKGYLAPLLPHEIALEQDSQRRDAS